MRAQRQARGRPVRHGGKAGFGLVELVVALSIASIVILGVGLTQAAAVELNRSSDETNRAVSDIRTAMEELLSLPLDEVPDVGGPFAPGIPVPAFSDLHLDGERLVVTYPNFAGGSVPDPLEVLVTVTWNDFAGRMRSISMATLMTR